MDSMDFLYKVEIELDDEKILADDKYYVEDIYAMIRKWFADEGIHEVENDNHMLVFASNKDDDKEFARFGLVETELMDSKWFRPYVKKFMWYNRLRGKDYKENILAEDKRYHKKYGG